MPPLREGGGVRGAQALDGKPVALRPVWRRDARVADIAKAFEEVSREFPPLV